MLVVDVLIDHLIDHIQQEFIPAVNSLASSLEGCWQGSLVLWVSVPFSVLALSSLTQPVMTESTTPCLSNYVNAQKKKATSHHLQCIELTNAVEDLFGILLSKLNHPSSVPLLSLLTPNEGIP
jgi:hypothetical protein